MERRLNVSIPEATFRRLKAWAGLQGQEMTTATAAVLEAGLDALGAPTALPLPPDAGRKGGYTINPHTASHLADRDT